MGKIIGWLLSFSKLDVIFTPLQKFLSGKKSYLAGAAIAIPALIAMIQGFANGGVGYLVGIMTTPEFLAFMNGIGIMGIRAAITKAADPQQDPNYPNQSPSPAPSGVKVG